MSKHDALSMWTVYDSPLDYPGQIIARRWEIRAGSKAPVPTTDVRTAPNLELLRRDFARLGLYRQIRSDDDEPQIVEVWF